MNKVIFYLGNSTSAFACTLNVFLWKYTTKVIVVEIDGAIVNPKSLTNYLPFVGKDRIQPNVAKLFGKIERNGYKFLYLSSRPINKFEKTRNLLRNIQQGGDWIPYGPIILDPTSVFPDVIPTKHVGHLDFKGRCLRSIQALFPMYPIYPFYSAFGKKGVSVIIHSV